jgi:polar amino acid transport system substrate-binding protein
MSVDLLTPGVLTVGIDASPPPPLHMGEPGSPEFSGFEVELMTAIAADLGVGLRYRSVLWRDMLGELEEGRLDVVCTAATVSADRAARVAFSAPYLDISLALVTRTDGSIRAIEDLKGRHIGVRVATTAAEYVWRRAQARRITVYDMNADVYAAITSQEVDAAVDDSPIASWFVRQLPDLALVSVIPGTEAQYALMLARRNDGLRTAVNTSLARVRQDGRYAAMYQRWLGDRATARRGT